MASTSTPEAPSIKARDRQAGGMAKVNYHFALQKWYMRDTGRMGYNMARDNLGLE